AALLGQRRPFGTTPWFWSDQYGHKLQMVGLSAGADQSVPIGDMSGSRFCVEHYRQNQLLAVDCVNSPRDFLAARKRMDQPNDVLPVGS
ncbi:MAG: oxidoreductase C-terminal domain-containing protein, partial [Burkholderiaceae bacterium]|nr:oxidoreductase C-terminal domain-containing protein [Burkholderiaceae bacterium]